MADDHEDLEKDRQRQEKRHMKERLLQIGIRGIQKQGWSVTRERGGADQVFRITKNGDSKLVSLRTSQDRWFAFPAKPNGHGWHTLDDVDLVLVSSVEENDPPREAWVYLFEADEIRERFDRAYKARKEAGRKLSAREDERRGFWIPLYHEPDASHSISYVGGGAGRNKRKRIHTEPLGDGGAPASLPKPTKLPPDDGGSDQPMTIAKRYLSGIIGVPESSIKITIEA